MEWDHICMQITHIPLLLSREGAYHPHVGLLPVTMGHICSPGGLCWGDGHVDQMIKACGSGKHSCLWSGIICNFYQMSSWFNPCVSRSSSWARNCSNTSTVSRENKRSQQPERRGRFSDLEPLASSTSDHSDFRCPLGVFVADTVLPWSVQPN